MFKQILNVQISIQFLWWRVTNNSVHALFHLFQMILAIFISVTMCGRTFKPSENIGTMMETSGAEHSSEERTRRLTSP